MDISVKTRRVAFVVLLAVAILAFVAALYATLAEREDAGTWLLVSVVVLVLALAGELFLLVFRESSRLDGRGDEWYNWEKEAQGGEDILLRCANCRETFSVLDTGERPLRHTCPHCGRNGVLKEGGAKAASASRGA